MTTDTIEVRRPMCPNCGSYSIGQKWVSKTLKQIYKGANFAEHAEKLKQAMTTGSFESGDIHFPQLSDYRQLVISCSECGYTEVFDIAKIP